MQEEVEKFRLYGYDILINKFEPFLRNYLKENILLLNFGSQWKNHIPTFVQESFSIISKKKFHECNDINFFFNNIYLINLRDIILSRDIFIFCSGIFENLNEEDISEYFEKLNELRKKIAHADSEFTLYDFDEVNNLIESICMNKQVCAEVINHINLQKYKSAEKIPKDFFDDFSSFNNLPDEDYNADGGFIGRNEERKEIKKILNSNDNRIITISGAGGLGKTAIALKVCYEIIEEDNPYLGILWFSAKENELTSEGIMPLKSQIKSYSTLLKNILKVLDKKIYLIFEKNKKLNFQDYEDQILEIFKSGRYLLVIDNLETLINDSQITDFLKRITKPTQVLITSRKGLGELEKRYDLKDFSSEDAIKLFRNLSKEKQLDELKNFTNDEIKLYVSKVKNYPLLIKWAIGKIHLGMDINKAFSEIHFGDSDIAKFSFNDIFNLFDEKHKRCLYSIIINEEDSISTSMLEHLSGLNKEDFEDAIRDLKLCSFISIIYKSDQDGTKTPEYTMLSLTRGFLSEKLKEDVKLRNILFTKKKEIDEELESFEEYQSSYNGSLFSLNIEKTDEKLSYHNVEIAKKHLRNEDLLLAEDYFKKAISASKCFGYAYMEYAKFKYNYFEQFSEAKILFDKAIKYSKGHFLIFFNYGIFLKKSGDFGNAIKYFKLTLDKNPEYLQAYNELGRAYTLKLNFEESEKVLNQALPTTSKPNFRHILLTKQNIAKNYLKWSEDFQRRKDYENSFNKLDLALNTLKEINSSPIGDSTSKLLEKEILFKYAMDKSNLGKIHFSEAIKYFTLCFIPIITQKGFKKNPDKYLILSYYHITKFGLKYKFFQREKYLDYIGRGLDSCGSKDNDLIEKFLELKDNVESIFDESFIDGEICHFNRRKKFGLIQLNEEESKFTFVLGEFKRRVPYSLIEKMSKGEKIKVKFKLKKEVDGKKQAREIIIV